MTNLRFSKRVEEMGAGVVVPIKEDWHERMRDTTFGGGANDKEWLIEQCCDICFYRQEAFEKK